MENKKTITTLPFAPTAVYKAYRGKPGCMCGCLGNYYYGNIKNAQDWQLTEKTQEKNTAAINRIYSKMLAAAEKGITIQDDYIFYTTVGKTNYVIYLRD